MATGDEPGAGAPRRHSGHVLESLPNALYRVGLDGGEAILAHVETALRQVIPRLIPGDRVEVVLSPYDVSRGRIVARSRRAGPAARTGRDRDEDGER